MKYFSRTEVENIGRAGARADGEVARILSSFWMYTQPGEQAITPWLHSDGFWEAWVTAYLSQQFDSHETFIDVGAHLGYYTLIAANHGLEVHAIEPNKEVFDILEKSIALNKFDVKTYNAAASDKRQTGSVYQYENLSGSNQFLPGEGDVSAFPLDDLDVSGNILFKVDVEGHEEAVWSGMQKLWRQPGKRTMVMEWQRDRYADPRGFLEKLEGGNWLGRVNHRGEGQKLTISNILKETAIMDLLIIKEEV